MKNIIKTALTFAFAVTLVGCDGVTDSPELKDDVREITVNFVKSRTTISYEGSDVSHLVWTSGDNVAYVTDVANDKFKTAQVTDNQFKATIPAGASSSNTLIAVWPVATNNGQSLLNASAELKSQFTQSVNDSFDGSLLPMYARVQIPVSGNTVSAQYEPLGVVLRFSINDYEGHETEIIKSVTLTANENIVGSYSINTSSPDNWTFTGSSKSAKTTVSGSNAMIEHDPYIYFVVNRGNYTGVKVEIETDQTTYTAEGGTMDLTQAGRTLFRIDISLKKLSADEGDGGEDDAYPGYNPIKSVKDLTADGTYLIVSERSASQFYVGYIENSSQQSSSTTLNKNSYGGIDTKNVNNNYTWKIAPVAGTDGLYSLYMVNIKKYIGIPLKYYTEYVSGRDYISYFSYDNVDATTNTNAHWSISVENDHVIIKNDYNAEGPTFIKYNPKSSSPFAIMTAALSDYSQCKEVQILKLKQ